MEKISPENLEENHREIADIIGIDNLIALSKYFGGSHIYIPKLEKLMRLQKQKAITEEYNGHNIKSLAIKYNLCESTIYNIIKKEVQNRPTRKMQGQISFDEWEKELSDDDSMKKT